jgi:hypothetical protein
MHHRTLLSGIAVPAFLLCGLASASGFRIEGTEFVLDRSEEILRSSSLIGAEIDLGDDVVLRIDAARPDPDDAGVWLHEFSIKGTGGLWQNPCLPDSEGHQEGFPLPGRWDAQGRFHLDAEHLALTCASGAQGKCARFGYKPWAKSADGRSLLPLYEACVRMVRADYCGDGSASTRDGMLIDVYDDHGVMSPETGEGFEDLAFEAGWSHKGAVCVNHTRVPDNLSLQSLASRCPWLADTLGERCTEDEARRRGAVIFNRSR